MFSYLPTLVMITLFVTRVFLLRRHILSDIWKMQTFEGVIFYTFLFSNVICNFQIPSLPEF